MDSEHEVFNPDMIELEEDRRRELGGLLGESTPSDCTYSKGYMKRQMLWICLTCNARSAEKPTQGGFCTACALNCHEHHEVVGIGSRRFFRCDCGNSRFPEQPCKLIPMKDVSNDRNFYHERFSTPGDAEHLQCIICEIMFPRPAEFADDPDLMYEVICDVCTEKLPFLTMYRAQIIDAVDTGTETVRKPLAEVQRKPDSSCLLLKLYERGMEPIRGIVAWGTELRSMLCRCTDCREMYRGLEIDFLLDAGDTMESYFNSGVEVYDKREKDRMDSFQKLVGGLDRYTKGKLALATNKLRKGFESLVGSKPDGYEVTKKDVEKILRNINKKRR